MGRGFEAPREVSLANQQNSSRVGQFTVHQPAVGLGEASLQTGMLDLQQVFHHRFLQTAFPDTNLQSFLMLSSHHVFNSLVFHAGRRMRLPRSTEPLCIVYLQKEVMQVWVSVFEQMETFIGLTYEQVWHKEKLEKAAGLI